MAEVSTARIDEISCITVRGLVVHIPKRRTLGELVRRRPPDVVRAVDGVDLDVHAGELVALVGASGSGKTTTAHAVLGSLVPTRGRVSFCDPSDASVAVAAGDRKRLVQMIYQDPYESLSPRQRVRGIVAEGLAIHRVAAPLRHERVLEALTSVGLMPAEDYLDRYPHELSGGQRQRVAIASAIALEPRFLVADEPVSMLDLSVRRGVLAIFERLRVEQSLGVLMITHDLATALTVADRVVVMNRGVVVEHGSPEQIRDQPRDPYTQALLRATPHDVASALEHLSDEYECPHVLLENEVTS